jgi:hypothetical protein
MRVIDAPVVPLMAAPRERERASGKVKEGERGKERESCVCEREKIEQARRRETE